MQLELERDAVAPRGTFGIFGEAHDLLRHFSPAERLALYLFSIVLAFSTLALLSQVNEAVSSQMPAAGGRIVEGAVGTPRFVNPLLAVTPVDQDLTMLTYSGLLRLAPDGSYEPDLAKDYEISGNGTTYTFHLRDGLTFHDGTPLTAEDVTFTIALAQNPEIKSPRRADWEGVAVQASDEHTVVFTLPHAYAPFLENATLGILPKELWENVPAEEFPFHTLNTHPVGSGPYVVQDVVFDAAGAPQEFTLRAFSRFALGSPHLSTVVYRAYPNETTLMEATNIDSFVVSSPKIAPREIQESESFLRIPLTRIFGVFFNQNHATVLAEPAVREALDRVIDKEMLVADVLGGFGSVLSGPIRSMNTSARGIVAGAATTPDAATEPDLTEEARRMLTAAGWTYHESEAATTSDEQTSPEHTAPFWTKGDTTLSITLATADTEELVASAEQVADAWRALGIRVEVQVYPLPEFNQAVLRPRAYDAILFGEVVGRSLDLYPFWHSSQRNDPGLNLSLYANADADRVLSEARAATEPEERERLIQGFLEQIKEDSPAVFLYSPDIAYRAPDVQGIEIGPLTNAAERFAGIHSWYRDTERVWDVFTH